MVEEGRRRKGGFETKGGAGTMACNLEPLEQALPALRCSVQPCSPPSPRPENRGRIERAPIFDRVTRGQPRFGPRPERGTALLSNYSGTMSQVKRINFCAISQRKFHFLRPVVGHEKSGEITDVELSEG